MADLRQQRVQGIRAQRISAMEQAQQVTTLILAQTQNEGGFFVHANDGRTYYYDGEENNLYSMGLPKEPNREFLALMYNRYGLVRSETMSRHVFDQLDAIALQRGKQLDVHRFAYWDGGRENLFISQYNGRVWRLDGKNITSIPNGQEVLFVDDDCGEPITPVIGNHKLLVKTLINDLQFLHDPSTALSPPSQAALLTSWLFALPFAELLPGTPLLLLEGEKGSGKTTAVERIQLTLFGRLYNKLLSKSEKDFSVTLLRSPICLLDNIDNYVKWLPNAVAAYATGSEWSHRQLFTDDAQVTIKPRSWIAVTTRNPSSFRRDDVADRCIVFKFARREQRSGYLRVHELRNKILADRDMLYGEWLWHLNNIVKRLREAPLSNPPSQHRLADYAALTYTIADATAIDRPTLDKAFQELQVERDTLTLDSDPLSALIGIWIDKGNAGRPVTARELYKELSMLACTEEPDFDRIYKSTHSLAARLRNSASALTRLHGMVTGKKRGKTKTYTFGGTNEQEQED